MAPAELTPEELFERIQGTWQLQSFTAPLIANPKNVIHPFSPRAKGVLVYTPDGYMSAQLLRPGQRLGNPAEDPANESEFAESAKRYMAYSGPFEIVRSQVRPGKLIIKLRMDVTLRPNWVGDVQIRTIELDGDLLTLGHEEPIKAWGEPRHVLAVWKRAPKSPVINGPLSNGTATNGTSTNGTSTTNGASTNGTAPNGTSH